jgi:hypothetical protein
MASEYQHSHDGEEDNAWEGDFDPFADPEERRVLFAAFDSFRYVNKHTILVSSVLLLWHRLELHVRTRRAC